MKYNLLDDFGTDGNKKSKWSWLYWLDEKVYTTHLGVIFSLLFALELTAWLGMPTFPIALFPISVFTMLI